MQYEQIKYDRTDGVATITLNRPDKLNTFTPRMLDEWYDALSTAHMDLNTRVILLTGEGKAFCAGADISSGLPVGSQHDSVERSRAEVRNYLRDGVQRIPRLVAMLEKPYICALNGVAVGAGMDMASMCDIRFAAESARVGMTYVKMAIIPGAGGAHFLPRIVGTSTALDMIWTGRLLNAAELKEIGYVTAVVPDAELQSFARDYATKIARGPAISVQLAKRMVYRSQEASIAEALEIASHAMYIVRDTEDSAEGPRAFAEKRDPQFKGR